MAGVHRTGKVVMGLLAAALLLSGCGAAGTSGAIESDTLVIGKEGTVTSYIVGVFDKEYYSLQGLETMAREAAAAYNTAHQIGTDTLVQVEQVEYAEGKRDRVVVSYRFRDAGVYEDYNETFLFYGTVRQAMDQGFDPEDMNQVLFDPKGEKSMVSAQLAEKSFSGRHLILVEEPVCVYCPYKIEYLSESARVLADGSVDATGVEPGGYPVIILMKK